MHAHVFCSFLMKKYLHLATSSTAAHRCWHSHWDNYNIIFMASERSNVGALCEGRLQMRKLHRRLLVNTKQRLVTLKSTEEIFTTNAFNQHDPKQKSIVAVISMTQMVPTFQTSMDYHCSPHPTQSLLCSIYLLAIIIAIFQLVPFLEKQLYK